MMEEAIDKYIAENPQDVMIFEELFDRAGMTNDEKNIFWSAVGRFFDTIMIKQLSTITNTFNDIPQEGVLEDPDE